MSRYTVALAAYGLHYYHALHSYVPVCDHMLGVATWPWSKVWTPNLPPQRPPSSVLAAALLCATHSTTVRNSVPLIYTTLSQLLLSTNI